VKFSGERARMLGRLVLAAVALPGNSFLQQLELQRAGNTLTLTKRY
jgi:hypothetical protein